MVIAKWEILSDESSISTHLPEHNLPDPIHFYITDWILLYSSLRKNTDNWGFLHKIATLSSRTVHHITCTESFQSAFGALNH